MKRLLVFSLLVLMVGCQSTNTICLPSTPTWVSTKEVSQHQVLQESVNLLKLFPSVSDSKFAVVDFDFTLAMLEWANKARFALLTDGGKSYVSNSWDCETRAYALSLGFSRSAAVSGITSKPLVAVMSVKQINKWANVEAGGLHAVLLIYTTKGLIVVESQNSSWTLFQDYPNKNYVTNIDLRG